jgi:hypothetical protein
VAKLAPDALLYLMKLCGQLTADQDHIRALAARKASDLIKAHNLTWEDVLQPPKPETALTPVSTGPRTWRVVVEELLGFHHGVLFLPREAEFLTGLLAKGHVPSERQAAWLHKICRRAGVPVWETTP